MMALGISPAVNNCWRAYSRHKGTTSKDNQRRLEGREIVITPRETPTGNPEYDDRSLSDELAKLFRLVGIGR